MSNSAFVLRVGASLILGFLLAYAVVAFIAGSLDPSDWGGAGRLALIGAGLFFTLPSASFVRDLLGE